MRRHGHSPADAQDLTQEFFARTLQRNDVGRAQPECGKFRWFLLAALRHFLANHWDQARAQLGLSAGGVRTEVHRLRKRYGELLRAEIAHTVADPNEIDDELRHLIAIVSR